MTKQQSTMKSFNITPEQMAILANPSCKQCCGLGYSGTVEIEGARKRVMCSCVHKALAKEGKVSWVERKLKKMDQPIPIPTKDELRAGDIIQDAEGQEVRPSIIEVPDAIAAVQAELQQRMKS